MSCRRRWRVRRKRRRHHAPRPVALHHIPPNRLHDELHLVELPAVVRTRRTNGPPPSLLLPSQRHQRPWSHELRPKTPGVAAQQLSGASTSSGVVAAASARKVPLGAYVASVDGQADDRLRRELPVGRVGRQCVADFCGAHLQHAIEEVAVEFGVGCAIFVDNLFLVFRLLEKGRDREEPIG